MRDDRSSFTRRDASTAPSCCTSSARRPARWSTPPVRPRAGRASRADDPASTVARAGARTSPAVTVLARVADVPGYGWQALDRRARAPGRRRSTVDDRAAGQRPGRPCEVDPTDGTFSVDGLAGLGRWSTAATSATPTTGARRPTTTRSSTGPTSVDVPVLEAGPLRGRLEIAPHLRAGPTHVEGRRRASAPSAVEVRTTLELRAGEDLVRVRIELDNHGCATTGCGSTSRCPSRPPPRVAECAFATVERGLTAEGGPTELGLPTFPSRRFVQAGGLTVAHEGLLEYELVDIARPTGAAPARSPSRCCAAPGCSRRARWPPAAAGRAR